METFWVIEKMMEGNIWYFDGKMNNEAYAITTDIHLAKKYESELAANNDREKLGLALFKTTEHQIVS